MRRRTEVVADLPSASSATCVTERVWIPSYMAFAALTAWSAVGRVTYPLGTLSCSRRSQRAPAPERPSTATEQYLRERSASQSASQPTPREVGSRETSSTWSGPDGGRTAHATATVDPSALNFTPHATISPGSSRGAASTSQASHCSELSSGGSPPVASGSQ